jgi:hypothetical protein
MELANAELRDDIRRKIREDHDERFGDQWKPSQGQEYSHHVEACS